MIKTKSNMDQEQIVKGVEKRAYEIFIKRIETKENGDNVSDWLKAEKDMKEKIK